MRTTLSLPLVLLLSLLLLPLSAVGQGTGRTLTIEGLDQPLLRSARSTAMGGTAAATGGDLTALFMNPAALSFITAPEVRIGGSLTITSVDQAQDWIPNRFYPNLSLLMEDMLGGIKDPDATDAQDRLQKPFDDLKPDWDRKKTSARPSLIAAALPVDLDGTKLVLGLGYNQAIDLDHFYQNTTILEPKIGRAHV